MIAKAEKAKKRLQYSISFILSSSVLACHLNAHTASASAQRRPRHPVPWLHTHASSQTLPSALIAGTVFAHLSYQTALRDQLLHLPLEHTSCPRALLPSMLHPMERGLGGDGCTDFDSAPVPCCCGDQADRLVHGDVIHLVGKKEEAAPPPLSPLPALPFAAADAAAAAAFDAAAADVAAADVAAAAADYDYDDDDADVAASLQFPPPPSSHCYCIDSDHNAARRRHVLSSRCSCFLPFPLLPHVAKSLLCGASDGIRVHSRAPAVSVSVFPLP